MRVSLRRDSKGSRWQSKTNQYKLNNLKWVHWSLSQGFYFWVNILKWLSGRSFRPFSKYWPSSTFFAILAIFGHIWPILVIFDHICWLLTRVPIMNADVAAAITAIQYLLGSHLIACDWADQTPSPRHSLSAVFAFASKHWKMTLVPSVAISIASTFSPSGRRK